MSRSKYESRDETASDSSVTKHDLIDFDLLPQVRDDLNTRNSIFSDELEDGHLTSSDDRSHRTDDRNAATDHTRKKGSRANGMPQVEYSDDSSRGEVELPKESESEQDSARSDERMSDNCSDKRKSTAPSSSASPVDEAAMSALTEDSFDESVQLISVRQRSSLDEEERRFYAELAELPSEPETNNGCELPETGSEGSRASFTNFLGTDDDSEPFGSYVVNSEGDDEDTEAVREATSHGNEVVEATSNAERSRIARKRLYSFSSTSSSDNEFDDDNHDDDDDDDTDVSLNSSRSSNRSKNGNACSRKAFKLDPAAAYGGSTQAAIDPWHQMKDIYDRQVGCCRTDGGSGINFQRRVGGSLNFVRRMKLFEKYEKHKGCVNALNFNETGTLIASGSDDLQIVIYNWIRKKSYIEFDSGHRANVFQSKFMPYTGDCHVVSCARDGQVRLAQLSVTGTCKGTKKLAQHKGAAHKLAILPDSCHVFLSCGEDGVTYQIDLRQEKPVKLYTTKVNGKYISLYSISSNPFNTFEHCVGGRDQYIRIYDTRKPEGNTLAEQQSTDGARVVKKFCPHHLINTDAKTHVTCAVYNYNGTSVLGTYNDDDIYLFNNSYSDGAEFSRKFEGHRNSATVKGVNFYGPRSEFVVSGSDCGNVFMWDVETETIINYFQADENGVVNVLEPHPSIPMLATSGLDHDVKLWMPMAEEPSEMRGLSKVMKRNKKMRESDRNEPELVDSEMLWFLMHSLRRSAARHFEEGSADTSSSENSNVNSPEEMDEDDDDDDDDNGNQSVQCSTS